MRAHGDAIKLRQLEGVEWFELGEWVQVEKPWPGPFKMDVGEHGHGSAGGDHDQADSRIADMENVIKIIHPQPTGEAAPATTTHSHTFLARFMHSALN